MCIRRLTSSCFFGLHHNRTSFSECRRKKALHTNFLRTPTFYSNHFRIISNGFWLLLLTFTGFNSRLPGKSKVFQFFVLTNNCTACVNILTIEIRWLIVWAAVVAATSAKECEWVLQIYEWSGFLYLKKGEIGV